MSVPRWPLPDESLRYWLGYPLAVALVPAPFVLVDPWIAIALYGLIAMPNALLVGLVGGSSVSNTVPGAAGGAEERVAATSEGLESAMDDPAWNDAGGPVTPGRLSKFCFATALLSFSSLLVVYRLFI